jgi:hypothetical protein
VCDGVSWTNIAWDNIAWDSLAFDWLTRRRRHLGGALRKGRNDL